MPVIEQFKAFIRHGRPAKDNQYEGEQPQQPQGHVSRGITSSKAASSSTTATPSHSRSHQQNQTISTHHENPDHNMSHPAETSNRHPHAPIGSGTATANDAHYHTVNDKSASVAAISQAIASGRSATAANKSIPAATAAAAAAAAGGTQQQQHSKGQNDAQKHQKEAERIVEEERLASEKLPSYPGLEERFTLLCKMGDGAFSNVYKARDKKTGQKVAIKVVRKYELNTSQDARLDPQWRKKNRVTERANILKEVQIMRNFKHPGIVELLEFSESRDHYYLILELLEGGELFHQIVKLTYFSEALARHVILQVAHGIRYLHEERGVIHRDIKPENLLFESIKIIPSKVNKARPYDEEKEDEGEFMPGIGGGGIGRVKIADFGLSKVVWEESTMTPCGTVGYTAPEIVKDERYSKSVDMWALGCVLYTLLCGFPPFYDESISVLTEKVAKGYYTFLSPWWDDISGSAKDLITHLLCVDSNRRYTIDEFLAHPWCNVRDPVPNLDSADIALAHTSEMPLDSPLLRSMKKTANPRALMSPGINQLKEAFDVTYAVHRQEEEGRRKGNANLHGLNEEDEDEEQDEDEGDDPDYTGSVDPSTSVATASSDKARETQRYRQEQQQRTQQQAANARSSRSSVPQPGAEQQYQGRGGADRKLAEAALYEGRAGTRDRGSTSGGGRRKNFELNIGNATLLGRRNKGVQPPNGGFNLSGLNLGAPPEVKAVPGSPMRVD